MGKRKRYPKGMSLDKIRELEWEKRVRKYAWYSRFEDIAKTIQKGDLKDSMEKVYKYLDYGAFGYNNQADYAKDALNVLIKDMATKLFEVRIIEINGEHSYTHNQLVMDTTLSGAQAQAKEIAKEWYGGEGKSQDEGYEFEFDLGSVVVRVDTVFETTEQDFKERMFHNALI